MGRRRKGEKIDGWMVIDKPRGITSTAVVTAVRRRTGAAKVGHAGTLDPLATGVLPVRPTREAIEAMLPGFIGLIDQVPPAFSAIKVDGERAYDLARADMAPDLPPRPVLIRSIALTGIPDPDHAVFLVTCGKGAYMRSLARDFAVALGTVGHIVELRRLAVGPFTEDQAIPLDYEGDFGHSAPLLEYLLAVETALDDIPALAVTESEVARIQRGQAVPVVRTADRELIGNLNDGATICALSDGKLVALTRLDGRQIRPVRVLNL
jgi:tRNA pseudouridine55 synthase